MTVAEKNTVPISVVIPTYRRLDELGTTLEQIKSCDPLPDEIIIHADSNDFDTLEYLMQKYPEVRCIVSESQQGPGGGRNKLIELARNEYIASFDDDSWPVDPCFFQCAFELLEHNVRVAAVACLIIETDGKTNLGDILPLTPVTMDASKIASTVGFVGCGAILRKSAFMETTGYLPLKYAYGMEEVDVSLQLINNSWSILSASNLRVVHCCDRSSRHSDPFINSAQIRNTALLAFLRYPISYFPYGILQVVNRVVYCIRKLRLRGLLSGILSIPIACWRYRHERLPVSGETVSLVRTYRHKGADL